MSATPSPVEALALELLAIPSVIGNERALADHVERWARARPFSAVERVGDNLLVCPRVPRADVPRVLLLGHLDTVPDSGPNPPRLDDERIHGLGASDMKCADALILAVLERAAHELPAADLCGVLYAREEGPYEGSGLPEILPRVDAVFGTPDLAVALEPTDNHVELGCLGTMHAAVAFHGRRAHSARPWEGRNAIHLSAPLLGALAALEPREVRHGGLRFREVASATMVGYEGARNVVPGRCEVNVNFRFGPDRTRTEAVGWLTGFVRAAVGGDAIEDGSVTLEIRDLCPSGRVCDDNPWVRRLQATLSPGLGVRAKQAWTDVGRLSERGWDAINFGPGSGSQAHQVGEWCSRERLAQAETLLYAWLWA